MSEVVTAEQRVAPDVPKARPRAWYSALSGFALAFLGLFAVDATVFRTELYHPWLEPDSYAGKVEEMLREVERAASIPGKQRVIVLGDSRIAEGFSRKTAERTLRDPSVTFVNAAVPGSSLRCWDFFLRWMPRDALQGATVVIPLDDYEDEDGEWDWADRDIDLRILAARLRLTDLPEYVNSVRAPKAKLHAAFAGMFRGSALRQDVQNLLTSPMQRLERVRMARRHESEWSYGYTGNASGLEGLIVNWEGRTISFPGSLTADQRASLEANLFRKRLPPTGRHREYRLRWFRQITSRLRLLNARPVFVKVPGTPAPLPSNAPVSDSAIRTIAREYPGTVAPADLFSAIERPACFFDAMHLNRTGRVEFTRALVNYLKESGAIGKGSA